MPKASPRKEPTGAAPISLGKGRETTYATGSQKGKLTFFVKTGAPTFNKGKC